MSLIALVIGLVAALQQQPPTTRIADGQEARVCGTVESRTVGFKCQITLSLSAGAEKFEVSIPPALRPDFPARPEHLQGADICAAGRIRLVSGRVILSMSSASQLEITKPPAEAPFGGDARLWCEEGLQPPTVLVERRPNYPPAVMRAKVQGDVWMEAVIDETGAVGAVRVVKPVHPELDESAIEALKQWKFSPGALAGRPVSVVVFVEMTFTLRK